MHDEPNKTESMDKPKTPKLSDQERAKWRKEILSITNPRVLSYIRDLINAKENLARAEQNADFVPSKDRTYPPYELNGDMKPLNIVEEEDGEEVV
jgi:hypothetical protein